MISMSLPLNLDPQSAVRSKGLVMTEYLYLIALGLALVIALDPFELELERLPATRHLPMLLAIPAWLLTLAGERIFHPEQRCPGMVRPLAPLLWLAAFIVAGGVYARFQLGIQNSFLVAGIYMWSATMAGALLLRSADPERLLRAYFTMLLLAAVIVFAGLAYNYGVRQVYHELEYLFPPLAVLAVFAARRGWQRWLGLAFFLVLAFLFKKNTGYLSGLLALGYLLAFYLWPRWRHHDALRKFTLLHWSAIALLLLGLLALYLILHRRQYLPSGSPQFRVLTYERAWHRFLDSPLWGTLFAAPGSLKFTGFDTGVSDNILPTHSDILDLLANGGVLAIALWLWGLLRVLRLAWQALRRATGNPLRPFVHTLACMAAAGVLTYAFNPILLQPDKAFLLWANLGFLVGASLRIRAGSNTASATT